MTGPSRPRARTLEKGGGVTRSVIARMRSPLGKGARSSRGDRERTPGPRACNANPGFSGAAQEKGRSRPVSRVLSWTAIPLGASSPIRSSNLPGDTAGRGIASLFGLAPGGVCRAGPLPDSRCALTAPFHPCLCPEGPSAVCSLLHFPSARAAQALPGTVPCGARTFLGMLAHDAVVWPAPPRALCRSPRGCGLLRRIIGATGVQRPRISHGPNATGQGPDSQNLRRFRG